MFDKREVRTVGVPRHVVWARTWDWWSRQGFRLTQTGPYRMHGSSFYGRIGLRRELELAIDEGTGGSSVDLTFRASITDEGLVGGAVAAVLFFPVAVVGGAISYSEYETDARNLTAAFWQYVYGLAGTGVRPSMPVPPPPCTNCGSALLPDWKVCPYCGQPRSTSS